MASKSGRGPGRAQRKGSSAGRTTVKATRIGRYTAPEESGKYTPPVPRAVRRSPPWYGPAILVLLILGVLAILLNYLSVLPGSVSPWYLLVGLVLIFGGFLMATRYH